MSTIPLNQSAQAVFGANGIARVTVGPSRFDERWHIWLTNIVTTSTAITAFKLYRQRETASSIIDQSLYNGNGDVSDSEITLVAGEPLVGVWTGGTPGAVATLTLVGESINRRG